MGNIRFDAPPKLADAEAYRYLFRIAQDLNLALNSLDVSNFTPEAAKSIGANGTAAQAAKAEIEQTANTLKGLIVKTAKDVRQEMDRLELKLNGQYVAKSEFGQYAEDTQATIEALPDSVTQRILNTQTITDMGDAIEALQAYTVQTEGFIKIGIVRYDGLVPKVGIAIGQAVETTGATVNVDGTDYDVIRSGQTLATYTSEGLSFEIGGTVVAYMTNRKLYILDADVSGNIRQGKWLWEQDSVKGLTLRYVD